MTTTNTVPALFGCKYPIFLAGMNVAAGPELAAAVTNAGGLGVIGGLHASPDFLQKQIDLLKSHLVDKSGPFGVDLLLPKIGAGARKTNYDYTKGKLPELIDVVCSSGAKLFVCAVGVPPRWVVDKLHNNNILVMNMIGHPKHATKALSAGVDLLCAQGGEAGGHTGDISTLVLIPAVLDIIKGKVSPLTGQRVMVIAAGGIVDGRGMAAALAMGADGVWIGTRFICATEAGAHPLHQKEVLSCGPDDTFRTLAYTGRPLRVKKTPFAMQWENERKREKEELLSKGIIPYQVEEERLRKDIANIDALLEARHARRLLMGQGAMLVHKIKPAAEIVEEIVWQCKKQLESGQSKL